MKRKIIKIDEEKCDGCGLCIPDCPEGALQIIDGKARLISDLFCDGLGACIGGCPRGAITVEERDAEPYDENRVMENIVKQGAPVVLAHLNHLKEHDESHLLEQAVMFIKTKHPGLMDLGGFESQQSCGDTGPGHGGCPGAAMRDLRRKNESGETTIKPISRSHLRSWPVQLQLLNPHAPFLRDADLLVSADCVPYAFGDFHHRFLSGKILITYCPKLDKTIDQYIEKLSVIFRDNPIRSITVVHMEVPCCSGTLQLVQRALQQAQRVIPVKEYTVSISGELV